MRGLLRDAGSEALSGELLGAIERDLSSRAVTDLVGPPSSEVLVEAPAENGGVHIVPQVAAHLPCSQCNDTCSATPTYTHTHTHTHKPDGINC